jgi:hypothetical protein
MEYTYKETTNPSGNLVIERLAQNGSISFIPTDPANSDYQAYLATLASELSNTSTPKVGK